MKILFTIMLSLSMMDISYAQDTWIQRDSVNGPPRSSCAGFVLFGEAFIIGGLDQIEFKRKMYSYDTEQDDWDAELSLGGENGAGLNRGSAIGFSTAGKGYIGLGQGNTSAFLSDFWEYDPESESWTQKADFIGTARRQAVAFSIDSMGYVGTGQDINGFTNDFYQYNPLTNTWVQIADFGGSPRKGAVGFTMGGQGYVGTGDTGVFVNDFWQFQPSTGTWHQKADFPGNARTGASGWGLFPTAFIACGYDNTLSYTKDIWEYNYFGDVWQQRADFIGPARTNASAFVINGTAYLGMGYNGDFLDDFYAYTPILSVSNSNQSNKPLHCYPNPANTVINFSSGLTDQPFLVKIYNLSGQLVFQKTVINQFNNTQIDISEFNNGIYLFKVISEDQSTIETGKFTVRK